MTFKLLNSHSGMSGEERPVSKNAWPGRWLWLAPLVFMLIIGIYSTARYDGYWAENDSTAFTRYIRIYTGIDRIVPPDGIATYPNGYAYQAISDFVVSITGLDVTVLQQWIYPLLAVLIVLPAWVLYRELTGSSLGAAITTLLLFMQPEFLFVILRSSHEKFTRLLMMVCLFWLARSFKLGQQPRKLAVYLGLFYLTAFALIVSNNLMANSFILAIAVALLLGRLLEKRNPALRQHHYLLRRLPYTTLICLALVFIVTFYVYPPARHDLLILRDTWQRINALALDLQTKPTNAYSQVSTGWASLKVYFMVSIADWVILATSLFIWLRQGWRWLWRLEAPKTQAAWFLWLLYAAFAVQGGLSIISDASGALESNLQHRIFSSFSMIAVAVVGGALAEWRPQRAGKLISYALAAGIFFISILSVFKATNEPLLSNKWEFYRPSEIAALQWEDHHLVDSEVWTEFDERLQVAYITAIGDPNNQFIHEMTDATHNILLTDITRMRSVRLNQPVPVPPDALQVYDNGSAQVYHLRPQSPYQH